MNPGLNFDNVERFADKVLRTFSQCALLVIGLGCDGQYV